MPLRFRLDLGLGSQPLKLAGLIVAVWLLLAAVVFHDRLGGPLDDVGRGMLALILVPPAFVLACVAVLRWLERPRR